MNPARTAEFDAVIVGGGYVGCAAALGLCGLGYSACLISARPLAAAVSDDWDIRVFTLSPGSEQLLTGLGAWLRMDAARLSPLYRMHIEGDGGAGRLDFDAMSAGISHLATVVEGGRLQAALEAALTAAGGIALRAPSVVQDIRWERDRVVVSLEGQASVAGRLLVGADGTESMVRMRAGIGMHYRSYGQSGVVANFKAAVAHQGRAFQWFREDGVLAFLPLPGALLSMVWSTGPEQTAALLSLSRAALASEVSAASGGVLGDLEAISPAAAFPLRYVRAEPGVGHRLVLLGDAAHSVHPLAGQGVNLGFRDVATLVQLLKERGRQTDVAAASLLRQYEIERRRDTMSMVAVTDGLHRLFGARHPVARAARSSGMSLLDRIPLVKRALMRQAMR